MKTVVSVFVSDMHMWSQLHDHDALNEFYDGVNKIIEANKGDTTDVEIYSVGDAISGSEIYGKGTGQQAFEEVLPAVSHQTLAAGYYLKQVSDKIENITGNKPTWHILRGTHEYAKGENFAWYFVTELQALGLQADYIGQWATVDVGKEYQVFIWHSRGGSSIGISARAVQDSLIAVAERVKDYPHIKDAIIAHRHASGEVGLTHAFRVIQLGGFQQFWGAPVQRQMGGYIYVAKDGVVTYDEKIRVHATDDPMLDIHNRRRFAEIFEEACIYARNIGRISEGVKSKVVFDEVNPKTVPITRYKTLSPSMQHLVEMITAYYSENNNTAYAIEELAPYHNNYKKTQFRQWLAKTFVIEDRIKNPDRPFALNARLQALGINLSWDKKHNTIIIRLNTDMLDEFVNCKITAET